MDFPLILSGPILRRVEPTLVSVWLALSKPCTVELSLWNGRVKDDSSDILFKFIDGAKITEATTETRRIGANLHVVVATVEFTPENQLLPGRLFSYNVTMLVPPDAGGTVQDLKSLGLLSDAPKLPSGKPHLPLGYENGFLPSFSLPPADLTQLRIAHGSCRRINQPTDDGMAWVDGFIKQSLNDPNQRLHQLLLTGDQIYADDVPQPLLPQLILRGQKLLGLPAGIEEFLPTIWPNANAKDASFWPADINHFPPAMRQQLIRSEARFSTTDTAHHLISFGEFAALHLFSWCNELWDLDELKDFDDIFTEFADQREVDGVGIKNAELPDNWGAIFKKREFALLEDLSDDDKGEAELDDETLKKFVSFLFCELPRPKLKAALKPHDSGDPSDVRDGKPRKPLDADLLLIKNLAQMSDAKKKESGFSEILTFARQHFDEENKQLEELRKKAPTDTEESQHLQKKIQHLQEHKHFHLFFKRLQDDFGGKFKTSKDADPKKPNPKEEVRLFYQTLPEVRRALANVSTYMVFDDHEITDDWNLCPLWRDRVLAAPLGKAIMRNGMLAFALFQGWGNDPLKFRQGEHKRLLTLTQQLFATGDQKKQQEITDLLEPMFGLNQQEQADNTKQLSWHFSVRGPKHLLLALDCRTRRSFISRYGPPGNISDSALKEQIPEKLPAGLEVAIVISSLPVFAAPMFDELVAPLVYRTFDVKSYLEHRDKIIQGMPGTNPDAIEGWANDAERMEALLKRLEPLRRVVLLSGDVHYGSSQQMSYWKKDDPEPARIVQLISSGMRNVMGMVFPADRHFGRVQKLIAAKIGNERLGWQKKADGLLEFPAGARVVPALKSRLRTSPVLLPTTGWPAGTKIKTVPDWVWRADAIRDDRADKDRPESIKPEEISRHDSDLTGADFVKTYQEIVKRHASQLRKSKHGRQTLVAHNVGIVSFNYKAAESQPGRTLHVLHELYAVFSAIEAPHTPQRPEIMTRHETLLAAVEGATIKEQRPQIGVAGGTQ